MPRLFFSVLLFLIGASTAMAEQECGWLVKKGVNDIYLLGTNGRINIAEEGYEAEGSERVGDLTQSETGDPIYREIDPRGTYVCACIDAIIDGDQQRVTLLNGFTRRPLAQCDDNSDLDTPD